MRVRWRDVLVYWLGRAAVTGAAFLPERLGYGAAALLGRLYFHCSARRRRAALHVLGNAYPGRPARELLQLGAVATGNVFKVPLDVARVTRLLARGGDLRRYIDLSQAEALLPEPPYLGLTSHLGSWEMAAIGMAFLSREAHGVARVFKNPLLQKWMLDNRRRCGLHIHPRRGGIRDLAAAMKRGAVGLQVVDQNQRLRGVFVPFFGELASTERAAASLALRNGYPIVVGHALRIGHGFRFALVGHPPFVPAQTGDKQRDLAQAVMEVNRRLEQHILQYADQYLWIHDRYRTRPANLAPAEPGSAAQESEADGDDGEEPG